MAKHIFLTHRDLRGVRRSFGEDLKSMARRKGFQFRVMLCDVSGFFVFTGSFCLEMLWLLSIYLFVMVGKEHFCWRFFNHYPCADGKC